MTRQKAPFRILYASAVALALTIGLSACSDGPSPEDRRAAANLEERSARLNDASISASVAAAILQEPALKDAEIHVETYNNVVHLFGYVIDPSDAERAEKIALNVRDVRRVKDDLVVR